MWLMDKILDKHAMKRVESLHAANHDYRIVEKRFEYD